EFEDMYRYLYHQDLFKLPSVELTNSLIDYHQKVIKLLTIMDSYCFFLIFFSLYDLIVLLGVF
ncbi:hypothetical protein ACJBPO_10380, partial [Streptococcus suis]